MAKVYIYSTLTSDMHYTAWLPPVEKGAIANVERVVFIRGGSGVANDRIVTPSGVRTEIDDSDLEVLQKNEVFKLHVKNGHMRVERKDVDAEKVAADMNRADPSAPKTPADYANAGDDDAKPAAKNM
ncbi:MAG TPA: hypothetical protein VF453_06600 [Burkholderiaceae bacterium]